MILQIFTDSFTEFSAESFTESLQVLQDLSQNLLQIFIQLGARRESKTADQESMKIDPPGPAELCNVRENPTITILIVFRVRARTPGPSSGAPKTPRGFLLASKSV